MGRSSKVAAHEEDSSSTLHLGSRLWNTTQDDSALHLALHFARPDASCCLHDFFSSASLTRFAICPSICPLPSLLSWFTNTRNNISRIQTSKLYFSESRAKDEHGSAELMMMIAGHSAVAVALSHLKHPSTKRRDQTRPSSSASALLQPLL